MAESKTQKSAATSGSDEHSRTAENARASMSRAAHNAADMGQEAARHYVKEPASDIFGLLRDYARDKPDVTAMWCFGLGLIVGWKLKP